MLIFTVIISGCTDTSIDDEIVEPETTAEIDDEIKDQETDTQATPTPVPKISSDFEDAPSVKTLRRKQARKCQRYYYRIH